MEYGIFKAFQGLLFFGAAFGFGIWQLVAVNREIRKHAETADAEGRRRDDGTAADLHRD